MALAEAGLSAFTALTLLFSIRVAESGRRRFAVLAGVTLALAVLVKVLGVLALPIPAATVLVLGPLRARLGSLALVYAVGLPPIAWAFRSFVVTENAQHMARLFTGGGVAFAAQLARNLGEGAGWLWTW
jgi:4-amino-4-deoxy-L-arabinose transferase-like glycosyltransferase